MKHLSILVPRGQNNLSSIVGAYKLLSRANALYEKKGKSPVFHIQLVGCEKQTFFHGELFSVNPHTHIRRVTKSDFIIVPSLNHQYDAGIRLNTSAINWLKQQRQKGAEIAGICTGNFLLAAAGLLNGMTCSTHWSAAADMQQRFPDIRVQADVLITDHKGIYTNGGAYSFLNLMIYLIEKYYDRITALQCAKQFQIDLSRHAQSEFIMFETPQQHDDALVSKAQHYLEKHHAEKINMEQVARHFHLSRRSFDRRFISATGNTPLDYLQRVKIEAAKKALENTTHTINDVMYQVGYADNKAFRDVFTKLTGLSPQAYKQKYNKQLFNRGIKNNKAKSAAVH